MVFWAICSLQSLGSSAFNDDAFKLVNRFFFVSTHKYPTSVTRDLNAIKGVFRAIAYFFAAIPGNPDYFVLGTHKDPNANAFAAVNDWQKKKKPGIIFALRNCEAMADDELVSLILHEATHYAGGIDHALIGGKASYGEKSFLLNNAKR